MSNEMNESGDQMEAAAPVDNHVAEAEVAQQGEGQNVPLDALQAERSERQRLQDELAMVKDNMQLMMQNMPQQQQAKQSYEGEQYSEDDVMTYGEFKKALNKEKQQFQMSLEELKMTQKHPDYNEVITTYLPEVLKNNPALRNTLSQTNDYELAYHLAKNSESYRQAQKKSTRNADAERIVQNANKAGSLSSVGQTSPISEAKRWKSMSDDEFMKAANQNLGYY